MAELTIEDYKRGARNAVAAGDNAAAKRLIAKAREIEGNTQSSTSEEADTSILGAVGYGVDQAGAMVGKGIQSAGELTGVESVENYGQEMAQRNEAEMAASNYQRPENADGIISNLREGDLAGAGKSLAYGVAEAAPQVAGGAAASIGAGLAATTAPIIGTGLAIGGTAYGVTSALGANRSEKEDQGLDPTATGTDLASAIASGLVELTPLKGGGATLKVIREGLQEGAQEGLIIGGTAVQGGEYVPEEVLERMGESAIIGGAASKGISTVVNTVSKTGEVVFRSKEDLDPETTQAAGDVSRIIQEMADTNGYNLKDIDPTSKKGAAEALEQARTVVNTEIRTAQKTIKKDLYEGLDDAAKSRFEELIASAKTKVARTSPKEDIQFVKDNFGNTKQGQMLVQSMYKANVTTELAAAGLKGGVSQFTDTFNPIPRIGSSYNPMGAVAGNLNTGAAIATGGQSLAAQIPLVVGGRAIDAVTGRRSKVNRFVKKNSANEGLGPITGVDVEGSAKRRKDAQKAQEVARKQAERDAKAQAAQAGRDAKAQAAQAGRDAKAQAAAAKVAEKERLAQLNAERNVNDITNGLPPHKKSPRGTVFMAVSEATGLKVGKDGMTAPEIDALIAKAMTIAETTYANDPIISRALKEYQQHLATGRMSKEGSPLNSVTASIKKVLTEIDPGIIPETKKSPKGPPPLSPQAARGKADNQEFLGQLRQSMMDDPAISTADKAVLAAAYDDAMFNLGSDAVQKMTSIVEGAKAKLEQPSLAEKYLSPYLLRVTGQQSGARAKGKPQDVPTVTPTTSPSGPDGPTVTGPVGPSGPVDSGQPQQPALAQQSGPSQLAPLDAEPAKPKKVKKPTAKSVKKAMPDAKAIIEIGRKGSKYENGIQDVDQALEAARLLGITAKTMNSGTALQKETRSGRGTAALHRWNPSMKGFGSSVFFVKPGGSIGGNKITSTTSLMNVLHEIGHSLTQGNMDGKGEFGMGMVKNPFSGNWDKVGKNSYNTSVMKPILEGLGKDHPAIKEIHAFQEAGKAFTESNPSETTPARDIARILEGLNNAKSPKEVAFYKSSMNRYRRYTNDTAELSVDPMWLYLMNPRLAKELMPVNTKLIRDEFKKANNGKIQFYSHPFATILAVVSAMGLLAAASDDDDEEPMMAPGILSA